MANEPKPESGIHSINVLMPKSLSSSSSSGSAEIYASGFEPSIGDSGVTYKDSELLFTARGRAKFQGKNIRPKESDFRFKAKKMGDNPSPDELLEGLARDPEAKNERVEIEKDPDLKAFYAYVSSNIADCFNSANVVAGGHVEKAKDSVDSIADLGMAAINSILVPRAGVALLAEVAKLFVGQLDDANKHEKAKKLAKFSISPVIGSHIAECFARRLTLARREQIKGIAKKNPQLLKILNTNQETLKSFTNAKTDVEKLAALDLYDVVNGICNDKTLPSAHLDSFQGLDDAVNKMFEFLQLDIIRSDSSQADEPTTFHSFGSPKVSSLSSSSSSSSILSFQESIKEQARERINAMLRRIGEEKQGSKSLESSLSAFALLEKDAPEIQKEKLLMLMRWINYGDEDGVAAQEILLSCLQSEKAEVRLRVVEALSEAWRGSATLLQALQSLLEKDTPQIQEGVINVLEKWASNGDQSAQEALLPRLQDKDEAIRLRTLVALKGASNGHPKIIPILESLLEKDTPRIQTIALIALTGWANSDGDGAIPAQKIIISHLQSKQAKMRLRVIEVLSEAGSGNTVFLEALQPLLEKDTPEIQKKALVVLVRWANGENSTATAAQKIIMSHLRSEQVEMRLRVIEALSETWRGSAALSQALQSLLEKDTPQIQEGVIKVLEKWASNSDQSAQEALLPRLQNKDEAIRLRTLGALKWASNVHPKVIPVLESLLEKDTAKIQKMALLALTKWVGSYGESAIPAEKIVMLHLRSEQVEMRLRVIEALSETWRGSAALSQALQSLLEKDTPQIQEGVIKVLEKWASNGDQSAQEVLLLRLQDKDEAIRLRTLGALKEARNVHPKVIPVVESLLEKDTPKIQKMALLALTKWVGGYGESAIPAEKIVMLHLRSEQVEMRLRVIEALSETWRGNAALSQVLQSLLEKDTPQIQEGVIKVLEKWANNSDQSAQEALLPRLQDKDEAIRLRTLGALKGASNVHPKVIPVVESLLEKDTPKIQKMALLALVEWADGYGDSVVAAQKILLQCCNSKNKAIQQEVLNALASSYREIPMLAGALQAFSHHEDHALRKSSASVLKNWNRVKSFRDREFMRRFSSTVDSPVDLKESDFSTLPLPLAISHEKKGDFRLSSLPNLGIPPSLLSSTIDSPMDLKESDFSPSPWPALHTKSLQRSNMTERSAYFFEPKSSNTPPLNMEGVSKELSEFFQPLPTTRNYVDRGNSLETIKENLNKNGCYVLTGKGGVGKTQLAASYVENNKKNYQNVLWIFANGDLNMQFRLLAQHYCGKQKFDENPVSMLYKYFSKKSILVIFDSVPDLNTVASFLPKNNPKLKLNSSHFLIISRYPKWENYSTLEVSNFIEKESLDFIQKKFKSIPKEKAILLHKSVGFMPVALAQAVAWIENSDDIDAFLKEVGAPKEESKKPQSTAEISTHLNMLANKEIFITYQLCRKALEKYPAADKILQICAFFAPEHIPISTVKEILGGTVKDADSGFSILEKYSLIDIRDGHIYMHSVLQNIICLELCGKNQNDYVRKSLTALIGKCEKFPQFVFMHQLEALIKNYKCMHKEDELLASGYKTLGEICHSYQENDRASVLLEHAIKILRKQKKDKGEMMLETVKILSNVYAALKDDMRKNILIEHVKSLEAKSSPTKNERTLADKSSRREGFFEKSSMDSSTISTQAVSKPLSAPREKEKEERSFWSLFSGLLG